MHLGKETNYKASQVNKENLAKLNAILYCSDQFMKHGIVPFAGKDETTGKMFEEELKAVADGFKEEGIESMLVPKEKLTQGTGASKERVSASDRSVEEIAAPPSIEKGWEEEGQGEGVQSSEEPKGEQENRKTSVEGIQAKAGESVGELQGEQGTTESLVQKGSVGQVEAPGKQQYEQGWDEGQHNKEGHSKQEEQSSKRIAEEDWSEKAHVEEGANTKEEGAGNIKEEPTEATRQGVEDGVSGSKERFTEPSFDEEGR